MASEDQAGPQLLPGQPLQPGVQRALEGQQHGNGDARRRRRGHVAHDRQGAERKGQHAGDDRRGAEGLVVLHLAVAEHGDHRREGDERHPQGHHAGFTGAARERAPDAAQEPRQGMGAQAGGAVALGFLALAPAALDADHEADGEGDGQPLYEVYGVHGRAVWLLHVTLRIAQIVYFCRAEVVCRLTKCDNGPIACGGKRA